jgi:hypothetical protein
MFVYFKFQCIIKYVYILSNQTSNLAPDLFIFLLFIFYLLTSAVNRNINIYKQEDGSGTLTQREPITLVTCYKTNVYKVYKVTGWEVRIEKYFVEVSKTDRGRRPRDVFETETKYFSIRTDLNGK